MRERFRLAVCAKIHNARRGPRFRSRFFLRGKCSDISSLHLQIETVSGREIFHEARVGSRSAAAQLMIEMANDQVAITAFD